MNDIEEKLQSAKDLFRDGSINEQEYHEKLINLVLESNFNIFQLIEKLNTKLVYGDIE